MREQPPPDAILPEQPLAPPAAPRRIQRVLITLAIMTLVIALGTLLFGSGFTELLKMLVILFIKLVIRIARLIFRF